MKIPSLLATAFCLFPLLSHAGPGPKGATPAPAGGGAAAVPAGASAKQAPAGPVELISEGEFLQPSSTLEFRFARPMISRDDIGFAPKTPPIIVSPAQPGGFTWLSRSSVVFTPSAAWPLGSQFALTLPPGLQDAEGKAVAGSFHVIVRTPAFARTTERMPGDGEAKSTRPMPEIDLAFNLAIDLDKAPPFFQFVDTAGHKVPAIVRYATKSDYFGVSETDRDWDERWQRAKYGVKDKDDEEANPDDDENAPPIPSRLVIKPATALTPGSPWRFEMKRGLPSKTGLKIADPLVQKLGPVRPFVFDKFVPTNYINSRRILTIEFAQPLAPDITSETAPKFFRVQPEVPKLRFEYENSSLAVLGEFELGKEYRLEVDPAVISEDGLPFQGKRITPFRFSPVSPRLWLPAITGYQIRGGLRKFEALSANLKAVKVKAQLVAAPDAAASVKAFQNYRRTNIDDDSAEIYQPMPAGSIRGKTIFERTIQLPADALDTRQHTALDWDEILGAQKAGVVFLTLEGIPLPGVTGKHPGAQALVQLTDFGLLWKKMDEGLKVTVFSMATGQPIEGAAVTLLDEDFAPGGKGRTDAHGNCIIDPKVRLAWMVATKGDDVYACAASDNDNLQMPGARVDYRGWQPGQKQWRKLRGFVFTDRPVYQPGETVHVKGYIRDVARGELANFAGIDGTLSLETGDGQDEPPIKIRTDAHGSFNVDLKLKLTAFGACSVTANFSDPGDETLQNTFKGEFEVAEYQPNAFEVKMTGPERVAPGADFSAKVSAGYLFGAPLSAADVRWTLDYSRRSFSAEGFNRWNFGPRDGAREKSLTLHGEGKLTGADALTIQPKLPEAKNGTYQGHLRAEVTDLNQQTVTEHITFARDASDFYLGLSAPEGSVLHPGDELKVRAVAIKPDGGPAAAPVAVSAELIYTRYETVRVQGAGKAITFRSEKVQEVVGKTEGRTLVPTREVNGDWSVGDAASLRFKMDKAGEYLLRATARDSAGRSVLSELEVFVSANEAVAWNYRNPAQLDVVADKAEYHPGDTARLLLKTPFSGEALVSIEREGRILRTMQVKVEGNAPSIEIPLSKQDGPNVYASMIVIRGREQSPRKFKTAEYRYGGAMLNVDDPVEHMQIAITPTRATVEPGEEVEAEVVVRDGAGAPLADAEVTFFAADEGVLQLVDYKRPDPRATFYEPYPLAIRTGISLYELLPEDPGDLQFSNKGYLIGGGADVAEAAGRKLREDFPGTACWFPSLKTDAAGKVRVHFPAPDAVTRYRLIAVSQSGAKFGSAESAFSIRKPLLLLSSIGQFANVGDTLVARAVVRNDTGADAAAEVKLELDQTAAPAKDGANIVSIGVKNGESRAVDLPVRLTAMGKAQWTWSAHMQSGGKTYEDHLRTSLKVGSSTPVLHETYETELSAASSDLLSGINPQLLDGAGTVTVTLANTRLAELRESANQLLEYPYGCAEQTISSMIPWAMLPQLRDVMPDLVKDDAQVKDAIARGYARLETMSTGGGFAYWPGGTQPSLFVSAYAGVAGSLLGRAGYQGIPSDDPLYEYLSKELRGLAKIHDEVALSQRALALYALAMAGRPEPAYHEEMFKRRRELSYESRALVALAILESHGPQKMVDELLSRRMEAPESICWFGSDARERAVQLLAWSMHQPKSNEVGRLTKELLGYRRHGHWATTQENAWALMALARYYVAAEDGGKPVSGTLVRRGGEQPFQVTREKPAITAAITFTPTEALKPVAVQNPKKGTLFGETRWVVRPPAAEQPRQDRGYAVSRSYRKIGDDGKLAEPKDLKVGDRIIVTLRVETVRPGHFVAIDDPLPAIFEAVNPAFRSQELGGGEMAGSDGLSDYHEVRSDRVLYFCDHMPAGAYIYRYLARVRAAGDATAGPTKVEEMYRPERFGLGEMVKVSSKLAEEK